MRARYSGRSNECLEDMDTEWGGRLDRDHGGRVHGIVHSVSV